MDIEEIIFSAEEKMEKTVEFLKEEFSGVRTGKASPALVENIEVSYYGVMTRLKEMANISTPEPRLIVISSYDPSVLTQIEKAILEANIGVTPLNDGKVIRVPIPELDEQRRKDLVKVTSRMSEDAKIAIRNVRREANDIAKKMQKDSDITEDDLNVVLKDVQNMTDASIEKVDKAFKLKEADILEI
ncbi:MAG: ribosome recycling factor [Kiritimatiellae bacterium]|jgi:ribosome recycling factor|nr:ribosome recycling factor [Kiritimatiellia bacterium]